jgi:hypothetical protein
MDDNLLVPVLIALTFATALNLFLILRLAAIVRPEPAPPPPPTVPLGEAVPSFEGRRESDGDRVRSADLVGQAMVLVFLSAGCASCREKVPELLRMLPGVRRAGIALWIIPPTAVHDLPAGVADSPLRDHVLALDAATARLLNPANAAPFYLFIDDQMIAKASGYVGDEDWRSFVGQMQDVAAEGETIP